MRILVVGASGAVGRCATAGLREWGAEVLEASRHGDIRVDSTEVTSIAAMFEGSGPIDAVVCTLGVTPFKPVPDLDREDYLEAFMSKVLAQIDIVRIGLQHVSDGGSFTLTSGVLGREPIATGAAASMANGALESFVIGASVELPRGLRINAVSPGVLQDAVDYHSAFPGFRPVTADEVGRAYVRSVYGVESGKTFIVD